MAEESDTAVILLVGLPASGKSTLSKRLLERFRDVNSGNSQRRIIHIEYDLLEKRLFDSTIDVPGENFLRDDNDMNTYFDQRIAWKIARREADERLEEIVSLLDNHGEKKSNNAQPPSTVVLMDDNFHLRGMRKQIHRLLLKYGQIQFGVLYVKTPVYVCLERNRRRTGSHRVPDDVILKMNNSFEPPRTTWERNSTIDIDLVHDCCITNCLVCINSDEDFTNVVVDFKKYSSLENKILGLIDSCPVILDTTYSDGYIENQKQQAATDRALTIKNQIHRFDKLLRSYVGTVAKFDKKYAKTANAGRRKIMDDLKSSRLVIELDNEVDNDKLINTFLELVIQSNKRQLEDKGVISALRKALRPL